MEYVPGIKINRIQALDQLGVDRKRWAETYIIQFVEPWNLPISFIFIHVLVL